MSSNGSTTSQLFGQLSEFMEEIATEKTAGHDPGGYDGASTHPSADADDSTADAQEGSRSSENTSDVKSEIEGVSPDDLPELSADKDEQDNRQLNIGTNQSATGDDPAVEDDFKGDKEDPGTEHPAVTDDGEKYGSLEEKYAAMSFVDARNRALELGNEILASLATGAATKVASANTETAQTTESTEAAEAGYKLAAVLGMEEMTDEQRAQASIAQTIKEASLDADLVGNYLTELAVMAEKSANEELPPELAGGGELPPELLDPSGGGAEGDIEGEPSGMEEGGELGGELGGLGEELGGGGLGEELGGGGPGEEDIAAALGGLEGAPEEVGEGT